MTTENKSIQNVDSAHAIILGSLAVAAVALALIFGSWADSKPSNPHAYRDSEFQHIGQGWNDFWGN